MVCFRSYIGLFLVLAGVLSVGDALDCVVCTNCQSTDDIKTVTCMPPASNSCVKSVQQRFNEHEYRVHRKCSKRKLEIDYLVECDGDPDVGKQCLHYCSSDECNSASILSSRRSLLFLVVTVSIFGIFMQ